MSKSFTQEQVDAALEKATAKAEKTAATAVKAETKRILSLVKQFSDENKFVENKEVKAAVSKVLKNLVATIKETE